MAKVLIIDDDEQLCTTLGYILEPLGHSCSCSLTLQTGLASVEAEEFDIVFLDVQLPDGSGLDILPEVRKKHSHPEVIIITSAGDPDGAETAIKNGAWDYIQKPFRKSDITLQVTKAVEYRNAKITQQQPVALHRSKIIGNSYMLEKCIDLVAQASAGDVSVLIAGETGTGKELFAHAIHENSARREKSFIVVDCAALPETLLESQLFGYKKGAFTGADADKEGLIKQADGGTLFLDEIGELPLKFQKAFLRVLQERRFRPISSSEEEKSDFKLVCATNRNLQDMVDKGDFRQDLLFRIQQISIYIPPLRERREDIKELAIYYVAQLCTRDNIPLKGISQEYFDKLVAYAWPGNIRELINTLEWSLKSANSDMEIIPQHLPEHIRVQLARDSIRKRGAAALSQTQPALRAETFPSLHQNRDKAERQYLQDLISLSTGEIQEACRLSGLTRQHLYNLLKKHKMSLR